MTGEHETIPLAESTPFDPKRARLPMTRAILLELLYDNHTRNGISLFAIRKQLEQRYYFSMKKRRYNILKQELRDMLDTGAVVKVSGNGLVGRMRLSSGERQAMSKSIKKLQVSLRKHADDTVTPEEAMNAYMRDLQQQKAPEAPVKRIEPRRQNKRLNRLSKAEETAELTDLAKSIVSEAHSTPLSRRGWRRNIV